MAIWFFDAPGYVKDFPDPTDWHDAMAAEARGIVRELVASVLRKDPDRVTNEDIIREAPTLGYVDPVSTPEPGGDTLAIAPWGAFPRAVRRSGPWTEFPPVEGDADGIHRAAEQLGDEDHRRGEFVDSKDDIIRLPVRHRQDEYMEWAARRDANGKLVKVIFVAEGYDYFSKLFEKDEKTVRDLYREFTGKSGIEADDLRAVNGVYRRFTDGSRQEVVAPGAFNPRNQLNIDPGIVHLSHRANSLSAEVNLAGVSAILRLKADGTTILDGIDSEELLCCCQGGNPNRNSDPLISAQAYTQVKSGYRYTLANPVGLYIASADHHRVMTNTGEELGPNWWTAVRGEGWDTGQSRVLRLELAPPPGSGLTLEDLEVDGVPVRFASQLADLLQIHLFVTRWKRTDGSLGPSVPCTGTCCRKDGAQHLLTTDGACAPGYSLAYPGLIDGPGATAVVAKVSRSQTLR
jgi:hypothetical protein